MYSTLYTYSLYWNYSFEYDKNNENNIIFQRYYAYWITTYGYMRLTTSDINFIKMSYFIEAFCTANELYYTNDIHIYKSLFVITVSLLFGIVI